MASKVTTIIALDAMGGDKAPQIVFEGASFVLKQRKNVHFLIFGNEDTLKRYIARYPLLEKHCTLCHAGEEVTNFTKPSAALRQAAASGMGLAIKAVSEGRASAVVSAGNTGAYMALSKMILKTLSGVDRPAIAKIMPTATGKSVVLDLGANAECKVEHLVQFGIMGSVLAEYSHISTAALNKQAHQSTGNDLKENATNSALNAPRQKPSISNQSSDAPLVGLLNIGSEASKGLPLLQQAAAYLEQHVNFHGFVEGDDITAGTTDVVVTDGFTGNVALKAIEGTARLIKLFLKDALSTHITGKLGYLIAKKSFKNLSDRMDPRLYNGAILLGLRGIAVKSHGGTDGIGYAEAIKVALDLTSDLTHIKDQTDPISQEDLPEENETSEALLQKETDNSLEDAPQLSFNRTIQERLAKVCFKLSDH